MTVAPQWTNRECQAWEWRRVLKCSEWAERHRVLAEGESSMAGPWRNANAPYGVGLMDLGFKPGVREIAAMKAAQVGFSELCRSILGYIAHERPHRCALVLPDQVKGQQIVANNVLPMFRSTPILRKLLTDRVHDAKKTELKLSNDFLLYLMWSGSSTSLASHPIRYAIADELDKFAPYTGKEADPLSLLRKRQRTHERWGAKLWKISTPTTAGRGIAAEFDASDLKLNYLLPCPHCNRRIKLLFDGVKWPKPDAYRDDRRGLARYVEAEEAAWYECQSCGGWIFERDRRRLVQMGCWGTCDEHGVADGLVEDAEAVETFPNGTRLGMHISALYPLWTSLHSVAAEFLRAKQREDEGDPMPLFDFFAQTLGEPYRPQVVKVEPSAIREKVRSARLPRGVCPSWTHCLIASVDTQKDGYWLVIRAWGPGRRSQRIFHGWVEDEAELDRWAFGTPWAVENDLLDPLTCAMLVIDSGGGLKANLPESRTMDVYRYALSRGPSQIRAIKGDSHPRDNQWIRRGTGGLKQTDKRGPGVQVPIWLIDSHHYQSVLADLMQREVPVHAEGEEPLHEPLWTLDAHEDPVYDAHLCNQHQVAEVRSGRQSHVWRPIRPGARYDLRMCEAYSVAGADMMGIPMLPDLSTYLAHRNEPLAEEPESPRLTTPDGQPFLITER